MLYCSELFSAAASFLIISVVIKCLRFLVVVELKLKLLDANASQSQNVSSILLISKGMNVHGISKR